MHNQYRLPILFVLSTFYITTILSAQELPPFPLINLDTRTVQLIDNKIQTPTPHLPATETSLDGRISMIKRGQSNYRFYVLKPESVIGHFKDTRNNRVGGNMLSAPFDFSSFYPIISNRFSSTIGDWNNYDRSYEGFFCEKTELRSFPFVCDSGNHDCYRLTFISRLESKSHLQPFGRFVSVDLIVMVSDPKTANARIHSIAPIQGTEKIGPILPFRFSAEYSVVGDQRLVVFRTGGRTARDLNPQGVGSNRNNIVYSAYNETAGNQRTQQCDIQRWTHFYPITHAHYDTVNDMKNRYKFARYPFRDTLGNVFTSNQELGGSYPWMDEDATNLFFTAAGRDRFYNNINGTIRGLFNEPPSNYVSPANISQSLVTQFNRDAIDLFEPRDRTTAVSYAGFWSHGKTVHLDGLLNNTDFNFKISTRGIIDHTRRLKLYSWGPQGQEYEPTGMTRDLGDIAQYNQYAPNMVTNSTFMNSMTNRFNFLDKMKPGVPRDITWHFSLTRHGEELVFDDYISPFVLIYADMNAALRKNNDVNDFSMVLQNGYLNGSQVSHPTNVSGVTSPNYHTLAFQNAATSIDKFLTVPKFGLPIGLVRSEPIAKGGVYGKGVWLNGRAGLSFELPAQSDDSNRLNLYQHNDYYFSVFIDPRWNGGLNQAVSRDLFQLGNGRKIQLAKLNTHTSNSQIKFDTVLMLDTDSSIIGRHDLTGLNRFFDRGWKHLAIQFVKNQNPALYIDGMRVGTMTPTITTDLWRARNITLYQGNKVILGSNQSFHFYGVQAWFDEFKVIARNITSTEEICNHARGTLVKVNNNAHEFWRTKSSNYPNWVHDVIKNQSGSPSGSKFVCVTEYGNYSTDALTSIEPAASLHRIPTNTVSVREPIIHQLKILRSDRPRPGHVNNNFCLSCHAQPSQNPFPELNTNALTWANINMVDDPRRLPSQPPANINGIIPANYFAPGKPSIKLNDLDSRRVDPFLD